MRLPSAVVMFATPMFIDVAIFARSPVTVTVSPGFNVSLRQPAR